MWQGMASFDVYGTANMTDYFVACGIGAIVPGAGRCSSAAWHGTSTNGSGPTAGITSSVTSGWAGFAYNPDSTNATATFILNSTGSGAANQWAFINVEANGGISLWKGVNQIIGTRLAVTAAGLVQLGHYTAIGVEFKQGGAGYLRVYVNGRLVADTGTVNMLANFTDGLPWGGITFSPIGYIDDCIWGDTDTSNPLDTQASYPGDLHVEGQLCLTDAIGGGGTFREWTTSAGTDHGALLDENPPDGDTTYVASQTVSQRESVKFPAIIPNTGAVYAIQHLPSLLKTTFAARTIQVGTYVGATENYQTAQAPAQTNYRYYPAVMGYNPVAAAAWTITTANAEEALIKIAS